MKLLDEVHSEDGSIKSLWEIRPGISVESVQFTLAGRRHVCISSQAGCNLACLFCETGKQKNMLDLSAEDIVAQVRNSITRDGGSMAPASAPFYVAQFAGMGEPLRNTAAVGQAARDLFDQGLATEVTLTTAGVVSALPELAAIPLTRLNVSLHASTDAVRDRLVPINRKYPIAQLMAGVHQYRETCGVPVTFNYLMFDGVNDSDGDAERLAGLLLHGGHRYPLRLKMWNPIAGTGLTPSPRARVDRFRQLLGAEGFEVLLCESMGSDVGAGCGQLRSLDRQLVRRKSVPLAVI